MISTFSVVARDPLHRQHVALRERLDNTVNYGIWCRGAGNSDVMAGDLPSRSSLRHMLGLRGFPSADLLATFVPISHPATSPGLRPKCQAIERPLAESAKGLHMDVHMRRPNVLASLFVLVPLLGCGTPGITQLAQSCPTLAILAQASEVTIVRPGGQARDDVALSAEMLPATMACDYELGDPDVTVELSVPISVRRGPAAGEPQSLDYFVAVVDPNGNIISKRLFARDVPAGNTPVGTLTEYVNGTTIGLAQNRQPSEYQVLIGFQLTADEYARNQAEPLLRP